ncbi:MAG: hypothetical protein KC457_23355 [Myxococcales bacterium]|nr:hypothetical protein [Myxococcales bacterium]
MAEAGSTSAAPAGRGARPGPQGLALILAALALLCVHLLLVRYYFGAALLAEIPYSRGDFATHAAQVRRVLEAWQSSGRHWGYDVQLLAGAPNGVLFDADNKGWELWTLALVKLGVGEGKAYNAFVLMIHLAMPPVVYAAARVLRLDRAAALTVTGLAIGLWGFDSFTRWMWHIGTVSYVFVAFFALLPLALFHRWIEDRKGIFALGCGLSLAFAHLIHPYIFFILAAPMLGEYVRAGLVERSLSWREHGITWGIAALTLVVNGWWLATALDFVHYILDSAHFEQSGLSFAFYDSLGLLLDAQTQGWIGSRTAFRVFYLLLALFALRSWRRAGDRRRLPFMLLIGVMAAFAYLGGYTPVAQLQPYRHALPLGFGLLIPAGWWLREAARERPWRTLQGGQRALALALAVLAGLHLLRDVLYFFAPSLPDRQVLEDGREVPLGMLGHAYTPGYRYEDQPDWEALVAWIDEHDDGRGRWLVQDQVLGEYLMARTKAQYIGGFLVRNIEHSDGNWFRRAGPNPPYDPRAMAAYMRTYGIRWVVVPRTNLNPWWDKQSQLFVRAGVANDMMIYMVKGPVSLLDGPGATGAKVEASINRMAVSGSDPTQDVVLRFHWMEQLICKPDCLVAREAVEDDRVGFIRVPAPHPRDFVVENGY